MNQSTKPRRSSASTGSDTRTALISAARRIFGRRGFDGASVRTITREAGVNLGAITYHFGSKRDLYTAVLEEGLRPIVQRLRAAAESGGTALDRIVRVVEAYFAHFETYPDLPHLLLQEVAAGKEPPTVVREVVQELKRTIAELQAEGQRDGSVRPGHPMLTALSVVSQPVYLTLVAPLLRDVAGVDLADPETRKIVVAHATAFVRAAQIQDWPG